MELVSKKGGYRDLKYDNLKGLAIFLVVVAHCIVNVAIFTKADAAASLGIFRLIVVLFPMPLFVFASGYFSKIREGESIKTFRNILIPYFIFNTILFILTYLFQGDANFGGLYIVPEVTMWYLLCLFLWRIFLPGLDKIRHVTILSIILAVLIGVLT
ncbi:MAG: acyltransferase family protein, partial [Methanobacteriaceae archaeon]